MGWLSLLAPQGSPFASFLANNQNAIHGVGAGLASGTDFSNGLGLAAQYAAQGAQKDSDFAIASKKEQERLDNIQKAQEWLRANFPKYAGLPSDLGMDLAKTTLEQQLKADNGGGENYFGNGVPVRMPDGTIAYGQFGDQGHFNIPKLPDGATFMTPVQQLNTGTGFTGVDKFGNPTGGVTPIDNQGAALDTAVGKGFGESIIDTRKAAIDAQASLASTQQARKLLDSGVITGFGADFKVGLGKALQQMGYHGADDAIANSEAFVATRAQEVGRLIKMFGAGTGLSDADREFATKAAAGSIELNEASLRRILDINERAAQNVLKTYNEMVTPIQSRGSLPNMTVGTPSGPGAPTTNYKEKYGLD
jgi:hypothetical protein